MKQPITRKWGFVLVPGSETMLLSRPSKLPCKSFSLPAKLSCPRMNGDICENCYAYERGMYQFECVKRAQKLRFEWTVQCMRTAEGRNTWVAVMVAAIGHRAKYFRIHDSGDVFNAAYAECWYRVAMALPHCEFWLPTRAWQQPKGALPILDPVMQWLRKLAALPNVTVRPSALNFGDKAPTVEGLHAGTTSQHAETFQCPAHSQGNQCGNCRHCWHVKTVPVSYARH